MAQQKKTKKGKETLQDALAKLEKIISELGKKDVSVDTGMEKFKKGVELIKFCRSELKETENEFNVLKAELEVEDDGEEEDGSEEKGEDNEDIKPEDLPF